MGSGGSPDEHYAKGGVPAHNGRGGATEKLQKGLTIPGGGPHFPNQKEGVT